ncbi:MAG: ribose 5-phosphate isomerase B [Nisaea sp.]|jgi:ribose 5-phosphate isomerase B|uniref:ribose 5-phosphate isomerase B n=1 Tax=Nisaea sp. TaxID=2024842 RepID=UPI001B20028F|nr:ribose 5-phosphate isomerase B [Nisaea sp.]MBO6559077.1 ribose 5-phosphate isomerase B [Nisaea sp.]
MADNAIVIGSDHAGFSLKQVLIAHLKDKGWDVVDVGTHGLDSVDYPDFGGAVAKALKDGKGERGIVVCGTGIGISIAANRHAWVRAALCHDITSARLCREHNDANVLALGARLIGEEVAKDCVDVFLDTEFAGGRHQRRVDKLGFTEST